jgi:hypothetical protein
VSTYKLHFGPLGHCPDCEQATEVRLAGVLGDPQPYPWEVTPLLMNALYKSVAQAHKLPRYREDRRRVGKAKKMVCAKCGCIAAKFHWAEVVDGGVLGQFCKVCLLTSIYEFYGERGLVDNIPIYVMPANQKTLRKARAALLLYEPPQEAPGLSDDEIVLF